MSHPPVRPTRRRPAVDSDRASIMNADAAAVEKSIGLAETEVEDARALLKEHSLLGKEQRESREVDLLVVCLHLGEICVQGEIEREVARWSVLDIEASFEGRPVLARIGRFGLVEREGALAPAQQVRRDVEGFLALQSFENDFPRNRRLHRTKESPLGLDGRECVEFKVTGDDPHQYETHLRPPGFGLKPETRQRNAHFCEPSVCVPFRRDIPEGVPAHVGGKDSLSVVENGQVGSQSGGRGEERERILVVVERVEDHSEPVVGGSYLVAFLRRRSYFVWGLVVHAPGGVEIFVVIGEPYLCSFGRCRARVRLVHRQG